MNIKIKLKNPKYCNGCLLLRTKWMGLTAFCMYFKENKEDWGWPVEDDCKTIKRPKLCIDKNGK